MGLLGLFRRPRHERTGFVLYGCSVAAARAPHFYAELGVPDTAAGRFELVSLHTGLVIRRLRAEPSRETDALAQAVFDAMFSDMDLNLREMGVGDLSVGKRVKMLWEGFHGRVQNYAEALNAADAEALAAALERNIWISAPAPEGAAMGLARHTMALDARLAAQPVAALMKGEVKFE